LSFAFLSILASVNAFSPIRDTQDVLVAGDKIVNEAVAGEASDELNAAWTLSSSPRGFPPLIKHFGPVMTGSIPVYVIYYGNNFAAGGSQASYPGALNNVLSALATGKSQWYNRAKSFALLIGTPSFSTANTRIVTGYAYGKALTDALTQQIINANFPTANSNALYIVVTDSSVSQCNGASCYNTHYCGYHGNYSDRKYAFVGTDGVNCKAPGVQLSTGQILAPAQGGNIDSLASIALHEITEAVTDPLGSAWFDFLGYENGDECNFVYGAAAEIPSQPGKIYNYAYGGQYYFVQQNYHSISGCSNTIYSS